MNFTSENIEIFLTVLDSGSFSAAARALKRVPSAISMAVANIEADLGMTLFERTPRKVIPTEYALALAPQARVISEKLKQLNTYSYELSSGFESTLKIGIVSDIGNQQLLMAIKKLVLKYPFLNIELITAPNDDILQLLYAEKISFCLANSTQHIKIEEYLQLVNQDTLIATISPEHPLIKKTEQSDVYIEDLIDIRQILVASSELKISDLRPVIGASYWKTNDVKTAIDMVKTGLGWGNFPLSLVQPLIDTGELVQLNFRNTINHLSLPAYLIWLKNHPLSKASRELIDLIREN